MSTPAHLNSIEHMLAELLLHIDSETHDDNIQAIKQALHAMRAVLGDDDAGYVWAADVLAIMDDVSASSRTQVSPVTVVYGVTKHYDAYQSTFVGVFNTREQAKFTCQQLAHQMEALMWEGNKAVEIDTGYWYAIEDLKVNTVMDGG